MASAQKPRAARMRVTKPAPLAPLAPTPIAILPVRVTKRSQLIGLLEREGGASSAELAGSLGWLPHTARSALTELRKKDLAIVKVKAAEGTRYSLAAEAVA